RYATCTIAPAPPATTTPSPSIPPAADPPAPPPFPTRRSSDLAHQPGITGVIERRAAPVGGRPFVAHDVSGGHSDLVLVAHPDAADRKSTRLNSRHVSLSYAVFCSKQKNYQLHVNSTSYMMTYY